MIGSQSIILTTLRVRYYDPQTGRFLSEDPIGFDGGQLNLTEYVNNDPLNFTDPSGTRTFRPYSNPNNRPGHHDPNLPPVNRPPIKPPPPPTKAPPPNVPPPGHRYPKNGGYKHI